MGPPVAIGRALCFEPARADISRKGDQTVRRTLGYASMAGWPECWLLCWAARVRNFRPSHLARSASRAAHLAGIIRQFSASQIKQILLDKYDSGYQWRSRFTARQSRCVEGVVLLPSAYENVSRMAAAYVRLLPQQPFLMVATRQSAKEFAPPSNMQVRDLAAYAKANPTTSEVTSLIDRWMKLRAGLQTSPELRVLMQAAVLDSFPAWIRNGLSARNAWREVFEREPVSGVLCGDDSNPYTRLPVLLAAQRKLRTVDFHHGALDGMYVLKELPSDLYLAKNEMERDYLTRVCDLPAEKVVIGAPPTVNIRSGIGGNRNRSSVILFSEPFEVTGMRAAEVFRELLPPLCHLARENGCRVLIKLHPFESLWQRRKVVQNVLLPEDRRLVTVVDGPLTTDLMSQAWFGITVESTTVIDCLKNGICCFLCSWLAHSPYEYAQQYARFGVGEVLEKAQQFMEIPSRLTEFLRRPAMKLDLSATVDPAMLHRWLTKFEDASGARSAS